MTDVPAEDPVPLSELMAPLLDFLVDCQKAEREGLPAPDPKDYSPPVPDDVTSELDQDCLLAAWGVTREQVEGLDPSYCQASQEAREQYEQVADALVARGQQLAAAVEEATGVPVSFRAEPSLRVAQPACPACLVPAGGVHADDCVSLR